MSSLIKAINRFISKGVYVLSCDVLMDVSLVKEINRLISKRMYFLLFDVFNGCLVLLKTEIGMSNIYY